MRYQLTLVTMTIIKIYTSNKCWKECEEKGTLLHCWWESKLVEPLLRTVWRFLKKLKMELPYDPAISLLGIYLEKNIIWKHTCTLMFTAALFTIAKTWKHESKNGRWMDKEDVCVCVYDVYKYIYIYDICVYICVYMMKYYLATKIMK